MPEPTHCSSYAGFLLSLSPALAGVLSAIALWVASRARTTSSDAQRTSQVALKYSQPQPPSHSVLVSDEVVRALRSASSKDKGNSA